MNKIKNLIVINRNSFIVKICKDLYPYIEKIPFVGQFYKLIFNKVIKRLDFKWVSSFKNRDFKILYIDKFPLIKYKISLKEYRKRHIFLLKEGRKMLDYLETHSNDFKKSYRNLDMQTVYENNLLVKVMWRFIYLYLPIQILLDKFDIENIYVSKDLELIYNLLRFENREDIVKLNYIRISTMNFLLKKIVNNTNYYMPFLRNFLIKFLKKLRISKPLTPIESERFNDKHIFNPFKPTIGFLYFSSTHKRYGSQFFDYLKDKQFNVIEIDPTPPDFNPKFRHYFHLKRQSKLIIDQLESLYFDYIKEKQHFLLAIYLKQALNKIYNQLIYDLFTIDYVYEKFLMNKLDLLIIFNENSFLGKISALICKQLDIPTIYIPHGTITEPYIFIFPRWCDIMILNSEIEKEFLLKVKLNPRVYTDRLKTLGGSYFKPKNLIKITQIRDFFNHEIIHDLTKYKYKMLLALSFETGKTQYSNMKIIKDLINAIQSQKEYTDIFLIIKLHPSDNLSDYQDLLKENYKVPFTLSHSIDIRNLIYSVDLLFSVPSTTLLEGILLKTPTMLIDYYYHPNNYLFIDDKVITTTHNQNDLEKQIKKHLFDKEFRENYVNKLYSFGLKFCEGFDKEDFTNNYLEQLFEITKKLIGN